MKSQNDGERILRTVIRKEVRENEREGIKKYETRIYLDLLIFYMCSILVAECHDHFIFFPRESGGFTWVSQ